jgi:probable phosphoglycerate mutase
VEPIPVTFTPRRVYLARHGATAWSESGRHTGRSDLPLQPSGETEAKSLAGKLRAVLPAPEPAVVLSSPLQRALETCQLSGYGDHAVLDGDLVEWDYGDYEGLTTEQIRRDRPGWDLFRDGCPNGEQLADVEARVGAVLGRLGVDPSLEGRSALLFAHGHLLRVLAAVWCDFGGESARSLPLETAALGVLGWSHEVRALEAWNL